MQLRRPAPRLAALLTHPSQSTQCARLIRNGIPLVQSRHAAFTRQAAYRPRAPRIPDPTPFVPDVPTFLSLIGRKLSQHSDKISSWDDLFSLSSDQMQKLGIEPSRNRRYLLRWIDKFRHGHYGIGGDAHYVADSGNVEVRLVESPQTLKDDGMVHYTKASVNQTAKRVRRVVNVPSTEPPADEKSDASTGADERGSETTDSAQLQRGEIATWRLPPLDDNFLRTAPQVHGIRFRQGRGIHGSNVYLVAGTQGAVGVLRRKEGLWEDKQGHKVLGGERRKLETLSKMRAADRRAGRA